MWLEDDRISLREAPEPRKPGASLIKIRRAGICGTDFEPVKGDCPYTGIPVHEFVGKL